MPKLEGKTCKRVLSAFGFPNAFSGLLVEYIVAIDVTRVRFPADASCLGFRGLGLMGLGFQATLCSAAFLRSLGYRVYSERRGPAMGFKTSLLVNIMKFKMMVTSNVSAGDQRLCCVTAEMFEISWSINKERSHVEITTNIGFRRV